LEAERSIVQIGSRYLEIGVGGRSSFGPLKLEYLGFSSSSLSNFFLIAVLGPFAFRFVVSPKSSIHTYLHCPIFFFFPHHKVLILAGRLEFGFLSFLLSRQHLGCILFSLFSFIWVVLVLEIDILSFLPLFFFFCSLAFLT